MTHRARRWLFIPVGAAFVAMLAPALADLPRFGHFEGVYGLTLPSSGVPERRATDIVSSITFDYRGVDTMGEEFILFAAVTGLGMLLRAQADENKGPPEECRPTRHALPPTEAVQLIGALCIPLLVLFGLYIVGHGQLTPGGGFQGGIVLASAPVLLLLAYDYRRFERRSPRWLVERAEATGAGVYVVMGLGGLIAGAFLGNALPLGQPGALNSGGTIPLLNLGVGLEVAAAIVVALRDLLDQTFEVRRR